MSAFVFLMRIGLVPGEAIRTCSGSGRPPRTWPGGRDALGLEQLFAQHPVDGGTAPRRPGSGLRQPHAGRHAARATPPRHDRADAALHVARGRGAARRARCIEAGSFLAEGFVIAGIVPTCWLGIMLVLLFAGIVMEVLPPSATSRCWRTRCRTCGTWPCRWSYSRVGEAASSGPRAAPWRRRSARRSSCSRGRRGCHTARSCSGTRCAMPPSRSSRSSASSSGPAGRDRVPLRSARYGPVGRDRDPQPAQLHGRAGGVLVVATLFVLVTLLADRGARGPRAVKKDGAVPATAPVALGATSRPTPAAGRRASA